MTRFTVELLLEPVENDDWSLLRSVIDAVPGSSLIEDPQEPQLFIPVDADSPLRAATFVDGLSQLIGFISIKGQIYEPAEDFDAPDDDETPDAVTPASAAVQAWVDEIPPVPHPLDELLHA